MTTKTSVFSPPTGDVLLPITETSVGDGAASGSFGTLNCQALTTTALTALAAAPASTLTTAQIAALTTTQLAGLTTSQVSILADLFVAKIGAP